MTQPLGKPADRSGLLIALLVAVVASVVLFSNLGSIYLWQDEASTAVLGRRMMRFGKPLAYDGVNLLTMDSLRPDTAESIHRRASDPQAAIDYAVAHKEFRADTTWIGHPWGSLLVAGASIAAFGSTTLAARVPFAIAALLAVMLFYRLILVQTQRRDLAIATVALLLLNTYWILHVRQCRYYALSTLMLVVTLAAFSRWRDGGRWGAPLFVAAAWCYFQVDYGSFWLTMGVLFFYAAISVRFAWTSLRWIIVTGVALSASIAPWVWYYRLFDRLQEPARSLTERFSGNLFLTNKFMIAMPVFLAAVILYFIVRKNLSAQTRRLLALSMLLVPLQMLWVTLCTPFPFMRYQIHLAPLACLISAWAVLEIFRNFPARAPLRWCGRVGLLTAIAITPLASYPLIAPFPALRERDRNPGTFVRSELSILGRELFTRRPDPNRDVIEWVKARAQPGDEVLVTYEDVPFIYYTDLKIRGGIPAFRLDDKTPPRFAVLRAAPCIYVAQFDEAYERLAAGYQWEWERVPTTDALWGNNPDPFGEYWVIPHAADYVKVARRKE
jgi:hypothetical protein